jgi:hypothetical protein
VLLTYPDKPPSHLAHPYQITASLASQAGAEQIIDKPGPNGKTTSIAERVAAEHAAEARLTVRRAVAAELVAATAAANAQAPSSPDGEEEREHPAVKTIMRLMVDKSGGPVARILLPDGGTTEFKSRALVIEETSEREASERILFLVINGRGEGFVDETAQAACVAGDTSNCSGP